MILIDWLWELRILRPTRQKVGYIGGVFFSQSLGLVLKSMILKRRMWIRGMGNKVPAVGWRQNLRKMGLLERKKLNNVSLHLILHKF